MKSRNVQYVGFLLVIMTMFYVLSKVEESGYVASSDALFTIDQADVGRIRVSRHDEIMDVILRDSVWIRLGIDTPTVPIDQLAEFLDGLLNMKRDKRVTDDPAQWASYGVDDRAGWRLELFDLSGVSAGHVIMGQSAASPQKGYIRAHGSNEVYEVGTNFSEALQKKMNLFEHIR